MQKAVVTDELEDKKEIVLEGLTPEFHKRLNSLSQENIKIICDYILAARHECKSFSRNYRRNILNSLCYLSIYANNKPFKDMVKSDILLRLDHHIKPEKEDPTHKWQGTYNSDLAYFSRFFKWLYSPEMDQKKRPLPSLLDNISRQERKEKSSVHPEDLWTLKDDEIFLKYCLSKRLKCYHMVARDTSCRPQEILNLKVGDLKFKQSKAGQIYAEFTIKSGKTGDRHSVLINSVPFIKDYLDHEHPQGHNNNAPFIAGEGRKRRGQSISEKRLDNVYQDEKKKRFTKLLGNSEVPAVDKQKIEQLLKKPWNPYNRRHTGITQNSKIMSGEQLKQYAGWKANSTMGLKYIHYLSNESTNSLLRAHGIEPEGEEEGEKDILKPKICPNCDATNKPDSKFCAECRMVLSYSGYDELRQEEKQKDEEIAYLKSQLAEIETKIPVLNTAADLITQGNKQREEDQKRIQDLENMVSQFMPMLEEMHRKHNEIKKTTTRTKDMLEKAYSSGLVTKN